MKNRFLDDKKSERIIVNAVTSPKDIRNRFCQHCNIQLKFDEKHSIYKCPVCNVSAILQNTQPNVKIRANFPTMDPTSPNISKIIQSEDQRLPRSEYFIKKRQEERNAFEDNDPYLAILKQSNKIRITNIEYYSWEDSDHLYE